MDTDIIKEVGELAVPETAEEQAPPELSLQERATLAALSQEQQKNELLRTLVADLHTYISARMPSAYRKSGWALRRRVLAALGKEEEQ